MKNKISILENRSVIKIYGKDNHTFLNNIISNNLCKINEKEVLLSTLLSPQGKILFDFFIFKNADDYFIECSKNQLNELINKLNLYSLRLEVSIEKKDLSVVVSNFFFKGEITRKDPRFQGKIIYRSLSKHKDETINHDTSEWYDHLRYLKLYPESELEIPSNKIYPFEIKIIYENGIDFNKGCFIGQEVLARVKYRGSVKKRYASFKIESTEIIDNGKIYDINNKLVGSLVYNLKINSDIFGFGILKTEHIQKKSYLFCENFQINIIN